MSDINSTINQFLDNFQKLCLGSPFNISSLCDNLISSITSLSQNSISIADLKKKCAVIGQLASFLSAKYKHGGLENTYRKEDILANLAFWSLQLIRTESMKLSGLDDQMAHDHSQLGLEVYIASLVVAVASHVAFPTVKLSSTNESSGKQTLTQEYTLGSHRTSAITVYHNTNDNVGINFKNGSSNKSSICAQDNIADQDQQTQDKSIVKLLACTSLRDQSNIDFSQIVNQDDCKYYWLDQSYDELQKITEEEKQASKKKKISMAEYKDRLSISSNTSASDAKKSRSGTNALDYIRNKESTTNDKGKYNNFFNFIYVLKISATPLDSNLDSYYPYHVFERQP